MASACDPMNSHLETSRPSTNFDPSLWGDRFITSTLDIQEYEMYSKEIQVLKEEVRSMLVNAEVKATEKIKLINTLERLGIFYHFEKEIEEQLEQIFHSYSHSKNIGDYNDLNTVAVHFRVFRQHGYTTSCDVFNKFKDCNGKLNENITRDVKGMLSLYEAAHLRIHGEKILDEAIVFTTTHLESIAADNLSPSLAKQVMHALKQPLHKGIPRLEARHYISIYEEDTCRNDLLLRFAKFDFNLVQVMHKQELFHISRWWKQLDFESKLSYARSRVVECYFWAMATFSEPQYSHARVMLTKIVAMASAMDDTYDEYGTLEEHKLFTDATQRWETSAIDQLPEYMKIFYGALLDLYEEFDKEMTKQERLYSVHYSKDAFQELSRSYYIEAKWLNEGYMPSYDEYISNALISSGYYLLAASSFMAMGSVATTEAFEWLQHKPKLIVAITTIARLMDNIVDHEEEKEKGNTATGIECYMKQHGMSKEEVTDEFYKKIETAWKDINEEFLKPNSVSVSLLTRILNLARVMDVFYKFDDGYTHPEKGLKDHIVALFIDPIPLS